MRIAYLDCFAGISGDMLLGALVDAGVDATVLHEATAAMQLGAELRVEKVDRSGITATKVDVLVAGVQADAPQADASPAGATHTHTHADGSSHSHAEAPHTHGPDDAPHTHSHEPATAGDATAHTHSHGRSLTVIRQLIEGSTLDPAVKRMAIRTFELLGASEAKIHNVAVEKIHFHEVGAIDAIVDIVAASAGLNALGVERWYASPVNVGGGMVDCAHGRFPVPAPATADLLRGMPTYSADLQRELTTPTGAAILRALVEDHGLHFGTQPAMAVEAIGYGAGSRNPPRFPNVLRLSIGTAHSDQSKREPQPISNPDAQPVTVLETALDDLSPQLLAYVAERALAGGAHDVMLTPVIMKKGRPGTLLTLLCDPADRARFEQLLLRETSTLGVRSREDRRVCLERRHETVRTIYGDVRMKLGLAGGETLNAAPEFEDCRRAAEAHNVPLKLIQQASVTAFHSEAR